MISNKQKDLEQTIHECEQSVIQYKAIQMTTGDSYHLYKASIDVGYFVKAGYPLREVRIQVFPKSDTPTAIVMFFPDHEANVQAITSGRLPLKGGNFFCFQQQGAPSLDIAKIWVQEKGVIIYSNYDFTATTTIVNLT